MSLPLGYVYCISHNDKYFKFGYTKWNAEKRLESFQIGNPIDLKMTWKYRCAFAKSIEKSIHEKLAKRNVRGEWFGIDLGEAMEILEYAKSIDSSRGQIETTNPELYAEGLLGRLHYYGEVSQDSYLEKQKNEFLVKDVGNRKTIDLGDPVHFIRNKMGYDDALYDIGLSIRFDSP